jgi:hypothetical protein
VKIVTGNASTTKYPGAKNLGLTFVIIYKLSLFHLHRKALVCWPIARTYWSMKITW